MAWCSLALGLPLSNRKSSVGDFGLMHKNLQNAFGILCSFNTFYNGIFMYSGKVPVIIGKIGEYLLYNRG